MKDKAEIAAVVVIVLGVVLIGGLVVNEQRKGEVRVEGTRFTQPTPPAPIETQTFVIPTIDSTIVPPTPTPTAAATPAVTASPAATATATAAPTTAARPAGAAAYDLSVSCMTTLTYSDGTTGPGGAKQVRGPVRAGARHTYEFRFDRDQGAKQADAQETRCVIDTNRTRSGSEPNLRIKLGCDGEGTYESPPPTPSTNVISRVWRPVELLDGFAHVMRSKPGQITERTTCLLEVV